MEKEIFPTYTAGDGRPVPNTKGAEGQGYPQKQNKIRCKMCGMIYDAWKNDTSGGTYEGAGGPVTLETVTYTDQYGIERTENYGDQKYSKGSGCPHCQTKNGES